MFISMMNRFKMTRHNDRDVALDTHTGEEQYVTPDEDTEALMYEAKFQYEIAKAFYDFQKKNPRPVLATVTELTPLNPST